MDLRTYKAKLRERNPEISTDIKDDTAFLIGRQIERIRLSTGMKQSELAIALGTKQSAISRLERGSALPSFTALKKIAKFFGTYVDVRLPIPQNVTDRLVNLEYTGLTKSFIQPTDLHPQDPSSTTTSNAATERIIGSPRHN